MAFAAFGGEIDLSCPFQQAFATSFGQPVVAARAGYVQFKQG